MKILAVCAHPDDEILGVGGTLLRHSSQGDEIFICIATKAYEPEWSNNYIEKKIIEQEKVDKLLNSKKRYNLDFPAVKLNEIAYGEFNKRITGVVDEVNPDIIYTHFEQDLNFDHKYVFYACQVAARPPKFIDVYSFETPSETEWGSKAFKPNYYINIEGFLEKKIDLFKLYKSEVKNYPHPRSYKAIENLAKYRGSEVGLKYAEAFILRREVWK